MLDWLVEERGIEPHIPVFDKSKRTDGTFSREDFDYDHRADTYIRLFGGGLIEAGVCCENQFEAYIGNLRQGGTLK